MRTEEINQVARFIGARRVDNNLNGVMKWVVTDPLFEPLINNNLDLPGLFKFDTDYNWIMTLFHKFNRDIFNEDGLDWQSGKNRNDVHEIIALHNIVTDELLEGDDVEQLWDAMYLLIHTFNRLFDYAKPNM